MCNVEFNRKIQWMTTKFYIAFHEKTPKKNDIARVVKPMCNSRVRYWLFLESNISFGTDIFRCLFILWNQKCVGYLCNNVQFHAKFISSIANQPTFFEWDMGFWFKFETDLPIPIHLLKPLNFSTTVYICLYKSL